MTRYETPLQIEIALDEITQRLHKAGRTPDQVREFFADEGERCASELEEEHGINGDGTPQDTE